MNTRKYLNGIYLLLFAILFSVHPVFSQGHTCGVKDNGLKSPIINGYQGLKLFDENLGCQPLTLKCNFVIIRRDDGTGNLDPSHPAWAFWEQDMNASLANITDVDMCSTGYPLDSKVRLKVNVDTINSTVAWDWYAEANADNFPSHSSPNRYICPRFDNSWESLHEEMVAYESAHQGEINFFFIDNGELVELLEEHIANGTEPSERYYDRFQQYVVDNPNCTGCGLSLIHI